MLLLAALAAAAMVAFAHADARGIINGDACILEGLATASFGRRGEPRPLHGALVRYFSDQVGSAERCRRRRSASRSVAASLPAHTGRCGFCCMLQGSLHSTTENGVYSFDDPIVCGKGTLAVQIEHEFYHFPVDLRSNKADIGQNLHVRHDMRRRRRASEPCAAKEPPPVEPAPPLRHDVVLSYDDPQSAAAASLVTAGCFLLGSSIWVSRRRRRAWLTSVASRGTLTCFGGRRGYWQVRSLQIAWPHAAAMVTAGSVAAWQARSRSIYDGEIQLTSGRAACSVIIQDLSL